MFNGFNVFNVEQYGAIGDGVTYDTLAIQKAIDECHAAGGGTVYFSPNKTYLIGTIYLKSYITLYIDVNSTILGSQYLKDYGMDTGICPYYPEQLDQCLIYAKDCVGITLMGKGLVDGGQDTRPIIRPEDASARQAEQRPMLLRFEDCEHLEIKEVTFKGAYSWCTHIKYCSDVRLTGVTIVNKIQDGFNIESSREVIISDCNLKCGDDGIALTTSDVNKPMKDLTVTNCVISSRWAAVRLGPLSKGNFENIVIDNCVFRDCNGGGIKLGMFEGAAIRNCNFSNIVMENVTMPIGIFNARWIDIGNLDEPDTLLPPGIIENISFSNIRAIAKKGPVSPWLDTNISEEELNDILVRPDRNSTLFFHGYKDHPLKNISLNNIHITFPGGGTKEEANRVDVIDMDEIDINEGGYWTDNKSSWGVAPAYGLYGRHIDGIRLRDVTFDLVNSDERAGVFLKNSKTITLGNLVVTSTNDEEKLLIFDDCSHINTK